MPDNFYVFISNSVKKDIKRIPFPWQSRVIQAISALENDPYYGEKLSGELDGKRKIRIWPYRVIYQIVSKKKIIIIVEAGHRQGIYK
ncbi:MAG: type II toxin-antitoxin system RelE/ParE family toxin [Candidatus Moranbacteria bacterium]|nr:type II toxin-antitoxin system RelE/ParE family toxin [Candidatus Moranbacteria bacterium]